eukprot:5366117-Prymnesium_polylepis.1
MVADAPSESRRRLLVVTAVLSVACTGGAVYGWPAMRQILRRAGDLRDGCTAGSPLDSKCDDQEKLFGLVFTVGAWANQEKKRNAEKSNARERVT